MIEKRMLEWTQNRPSPLNVKLAADARLSVLAKVPATMCYASLVEEAIND